MFINGLLIIYNHSLSANASTIMEHVESFERYSRFKVWKLNTALGFPRGLKKLEFAAIVLHYSPFGSYPFLLSERFRQYIEDSTQSAKIAFFQDEYQHCTHRFELINRLGIDLIYTLLEPGHFNEVYYRHTKVKQVRPTLAGYVCDRLIEKSVQFAKPFEQRDIDVGYRARQLPFHMGRGAREKTDIAFGFIKHCSSHSFRLDVKTDERDRIYGDDWYRFLGNCKFMLGVEAGVSVFDLNGQTTAACKELRRVNPDIGFEEVYDRVLSEIDGAINYRMISPRIFETVILGGVPLLFRGHYNAVITAGSNYIELEKDFSNIEDVFRQMKDQDHIATIRQNNMRLIESNKFSYRSFLSDFDNDVIQLLRLNEAKDSYLSTEDVDKIMKEGQLYRDLVMKAKQVRSVRFPGRGILKWMYRKLNPMKQTNCRSCSE